MVHYGSLLFIFLIYIALIQGNTHDVSTLIQSICDFTLDKIDFTFDNMDFALDNMDFTLDNMTICT